MVHSSRTFPGPFLDLSWSLPVGDLAVVHPSGYLEIKDRAKDIIISGGENISTVEVESRAVPPHELALNGVTSDFMCRSRPCCTGTRRCSRRASWRGRTRTFPGPFLDLSWSLPV